MQLTDEQEKQLSSEMRDLGNPSSGGELERLHERVRTLETIVEILLTGLGIEPLVYDWEKRS